MVNPWNKYTHKQIAQSLKAATIKNKKELEAPVIPTDKFTWTETTAGKMMKVIAEQMKSFDRDNYGNEITWDDVIRAIDRCATFVAVELAKKGKLGN